MVIKLRLINCAINGTNFHLKLTVFARRMKEWMIVLLTWLIIAQATSCLISCLGAVSKCINRSTGSFSLARLTIDPLIRRKRTVILHAPVEHRRWHVPWHTHKTYTNNNRSTNNDLEVHYKVWIVSIHWSSSRSIDWWTTATAQSDHWSSLPRYETHRKISISTHADLNYNFTGRAAKMINGSCAYFFFIYSLVLSSAITRGELKRVWSVLNDKDYRAIHSRWNAPRDYTVQNGGWMAFNCNAVHR